MVLASAGCIQNLDQVDEAFYDFDGRKVHCAIDIDDDTHNSVDSILTGLDRAKTRGEVLELYAHDPGSTLQWSKIEAVLAGAQSRGLYFYTFADFANGVNHGGGLAFGFDDWYVSEWLTGRQTLLQYGARVTFNIAHYNTMSADDKAGVAQLAADGHDIEAHSISHLYGPEYVDENGLDAYLDLEIQPSIDLLRADGYNVTTFAYPFGARTDETDAAILARVQLIRSITYAVSGPEYTPCPY